MAERKHELARKQSSGKLLLRLAKIRISNLIVIEFLTPHLDCIPLSVIPKSIHELPPLEIGGTFARIGFAVQDHVAAGHCLDMLEDSTLSQVWCETQDDVTLLWMTASGEEVEFVQVKSNELDQLWSIAKLLEKETATEAGDLHAVKTKTGDDSEEQSEAEGQDEAHNQCAKLKPKKTRKKDARCILEKSLQYDRCREPVRFRIVTTRPIKDELTFLSHPIGSLLRDKSKPNYIGLIEKLNESLSGVKSDNGNDITFWVDRTVWKWVHSLDAVKQDNLWKTSRFVEKSGQFMARDQVEELYQKLLTKVYDGGLARWDNEIGKKKIIRAELLAWLSQAVTDAIHPGKLGTGKTLDSKLNAACIPEDQHETIAEMRQRYRLERLTPKYAANGVQSALESDIRGRLMTLRSNLDGRLIEVDGVAFHALCINEINAARLSLREQSRPPAEILYGYMYDLADRCTHRFVRANT